nr:hypothetical protein [Halovivax sp. TS33]
MEVDVENFVAVSKMSDNFFETLVHLRPAAKTEVEAVVLVRVEAHSAFEIFEVSKQHRYAAKFLLDWPIVRVQTEFDSRLLGDRKDFLEEPLIVRSQFRFRVLAVVDEFVANLVDIKAGCLGTAPNGHIFVCQTPVGDQW